MKLLLITKNLPPDVGGMETLWFESTKALAKQCDLTVIGPEAAKPLLQDVCKFIPAPRPLPIFMSVALLKAVYAAMSEHYDAVLAGSGVTAPLALAAARVSQTAAGVYLHGLDVIYPNWAYKVGFSSCFKYFDKVFANSTSTAKLATDKGVSCSKLTVINPAVAPSTRAEVCDEPYDLEKQQKNIIFFGRLVERKGLMPFISNTFQHLAQSRDNLHLHIIGDSPPNDKSGYKQQLKATIESLNLHNRVTLHGSLRSQQLRQLLDQSHVNILPAIHVAGDVEGYGMTIIEAALAGVPTVAFDQGGISDAIARTKLSRLITADDYKIFTDTLTEMLDKPPEVKRQSLLSSTWTWDLFAKAAIAALKVDNHAR